MEGHDESTRAVERHAQSPDSQDERSPGYPYHRILPRQCPSLEAIDFELEYMDLLEHPIPFPTEFVRKIRTWSYWDIASLCKVIEYLPDLALQAVIPTRLADGPPGDAPLKLQDWQTLIRLDSLKTFEVYNVGSSLLLSGLPPNLEELGSARSTSL